MRILGIDPGLATMGWGVIEADGYREKLVQYGALITYPRDTFPTRLRCIYTGVRGLLETFKPDDAADAVACAITHAHAGAGREHFRIK